MNIAFLVFPNVTQLDFTAPHEVLSRLPGAVCHLVWKRNEAVRASDGLRFLPDFTFADCPPTDILCVPGGPGVDALLDDEETLQFIRSAAKSARYTTSVCTGSLLLGAAGLLQGKNATSHWSCVELLEHFGANAQTGRTVRDGRIITAGGVTAGIDFALELLAELTDESYAQCVQLAVQYDPQPPFNCGAPETAPPHILSAAQAEIAHRTENRRRIVSGLVVAKNT